MKFYALSLIALTAFQLHAASNKKNSSKTPPPPPPAPKVETTLSNCGRTLNTKMEFLWWTIAQQSSDFVIVGATFNNLNESGAIGTIKQATFAWDPGFRLTAGRTFQRDCWNFSLDYTFFRSQATHDYAKPAGTENRIFATFFDITGNGLQNVSSSIVLNYNLGEMWLSKLFKIGSHVTLQCSNGIAGAWIKEKWSINYGALQTTNVSNKWSFDGGGVTSKLKTRWDLGRRFELVNELQGALLVGSYLNKEKIYFVAPFDSQVQTLQNPVHHTVLHSYPVIPMLRGAFGFIWSFPCKYLDFYLGANAEASTWFDLHTLYKEQTTAAPASNRILYFSSSNVTLYGASFQLGLNF